MKSIKKRGKKRKILLINILLELCILVGIFLYVQIPDKTDRPEDVLREYMSYINTKDYEKMYDLLSEQSKLNISKEDFISRNKKIYEGIEAKNIGIKMIDINKFDKSIIINYETNMELITGKLNFMNEVTMCKNDEKNYCIEWGSEVIFPNLTQEDKVRITYDRGNRGSILDRNNLVLAGKGTAASVGLVPGKMSENMDEDLSKISKILSVSIDTIKEKLSASYVKPDSFVPLKLVAQTDQEIKELLLQIPGIMITDKEVRSYPLGEKAAHLTGYVQNINAEELKELGSENYNENSIIGKSGLEKLLEDQIRGVDGCTVNIIDEHGNKKETLAKKPKQDGKDVKLTIDAELQSKLYNQLQDDKSSTVVMNPNTGEILALLSTPAYNPNEFILGMSNDRWKELNEDKDMPMYNRFKAALCPGSSFKPIIAAIGLTTGKIDHEENFGNSGLSWQNDASWGNYKVTTLKDYGKQVNMRNALINSDNIYFAKAALKIGADTLVEQLLKIGFHESIPFEFGLTSSEFGKDNMFDSQIQLADSGYGQGKILVNPVHMVSIYSAFINDGNMVKPYLIYNDKQTSEFWKHRIFSKEAAQTICSDLIQVVEDPNGTGHSGKIQGVTIAGKTGTAEIKVSKDDSTGTELGWFVAFTVDKNYDKQYVALSMVEDVKDRGGSHYVIPIIKSVFED